MTMNRLLRQLILVVTLVVPLLAHAETERRVRFGGGAGVVWYQGFGPAADSPGVIAGGFIGLPIASRVNLRLELSWAKLSDLSVRGGEIGVPGSTPITPGPTQITGAGLSLVLLSERQKWGRSYFVLGAGGYYASDGRHTAVGPVVGPGLGVMFGDAISIGVEMNVQMAFFDGGGLFMVPLRLLVRF